MQNIEGKKMSFAQQLELMDTENNSVDRQSFIAIYHSGSIANLYMRGDQNMTGALELVYEDINLILYVQRHQHRDINRVELRCNFSIGNSQDNDASTKTNAHELWYQDFHNMLNAVI